MKEHKVTLAAMAPLVTDNMVMLDPERALLACRVRVQTDSSIEHYRVVLADTAADGEQVLASVVTVLAQEVLGTRIVLVTRSDTGWAEALTYPRDDEDIAQSAAAVAAVCASWGWDESAVITVSINDGGIQASPRFDGDFWSVLTPSL